jgi:hypothetical protein
MTPLTGSPATQSNQQLAVLLCAVTYSSDPQTDIETYLPDWSIVWNGQVTSDGNYAFIATNSDSSVYALAVRGSLPPFDVVKDWDAFANWVLEDMDVITTVDWTYVSPSTSNAKITAGANRAFTQVQGMQDTINPQGPGILDYLQTNAVAKGKQVIITGHSLGGNVANVFTSYFISSLISSYPNIAGNTYLVTFAAPAAGNSAFATDLDGKLSNAWHYENDNDIVPKFPVGLAVVDVGLMYIGGPSAGSITVTYKGKTVSLREAFLLLAGAFLIYGYTQQAQNYSIFNVPTDSEYTQNTFEDFFQQAGYQHEVVHYANDLGVTLPSTLAEQSKLVK